MKKKLVEGAFGIKMPDTLAKSLDTLIKSLPKEQQTLRRKANLSAMELLKGERADISFVSTETIDNEGEVVLCGQGHMDLSLFQKNPVVTFAHKYDELPVGKAQWIKAVPGGLKAKTQYAKKPDGWEGAWLPDAVYSMTQEGILKGKSIGFIALKVREPSEDEAQWKDATIIDQAVLLEFAVAPVPMNANALVEAVAKGLTDEATLQRLGIPACTVAKKRQHEQTDIPALLLKALAKVTIDPDRIAKQIIHNLQNRGRV